MEDTGWEVNGWRQVTASGVYYFYKYLLSPIKLSLPAIFTVMDERFSTLQIYNSEIVDYFNNINLSYTLYDIWH